MPRKSKVEVTAFEQANTKYRPHINAIYFLLDLYERRSKKDDAFAKFLTSIEENAKNKAKEEEDMLSRHHLGSQKTSKTLGTGASIRKNRGSLSKQSPFFTASGSEEESDLDEEEKDFFGSGPRSDAKSKLAAEKYHIPITVSEIALSALKGRNG